MQNTPDQIGNSNNIIDSANIRIVYQFDQRAIMEEMAITIKDTMALDIGNRWSCYYNLYKFKNDSLIFEKYKILRDKIKSVTLVEDPLAIIELKNMKTEVFDEKRDDSAILFKNRNSNEFRIFDKISDKINIKMEEIIPPFEWVITTDTASILGYLCTEASATFRGRIYKAWFTLDIPIHDGPWKLCGLPGLILKTETVDSIFKFEAIEIKKLNNVNLKFPNYENSKDTHVCKDLKQFIELRKQRDKNILVGGFKDHKLLLLHRQNPINRNELELTP